MTVSVSGAVLAALLYEHVNCDGDQEGFLLGKVMHHVTDTISDSQLNNRKEETVTYVYNYIPSNTPFSWYDHAGRVNNEKLKAILKNHKPQEVIGWYRWRRQSTMCPSLREKAMHRALVHTFPGIKDQNFLFGLFSSSSTSNLSTHSFDYIFQYLSAKSFLRLPVTVVNLKDTSQADYKLQANHNIDPVDGIYADTLKKSRPEFLDVGSGRLHQVQAIHALNGQLHGELKDLYNLVSASEEAVGSLAKEVEHLRERWKRKRYPPMAIQKDLNRNPKHQPNSQQKTSQSVSQTTSSTQSAKTDISKSTKNISRELSKQQEITEDLKDLFLTPIIAQPPLLSEMPTAPGTTLTASSVSHTTTGSPDLMISDVPILSSASVTSSVTLQEPKVTSELRRSASPALSTQSSHSSRSQDEDMVMDVLPASPSATRKDRKILNNADELAGTKSTTKPVEDKKPKKKDAFDFVNNLMEDVKCTAGLKRNLTPNNSGRQTRAQSMIVEGPAGAIGNRVKPRSVTPTREPGHRPASTRNTKTKSSTLPVGMASPRLDQSFEDDLPSSPTF